MKCDEVYASRTLGLALFRPQADTVHTADTDSFSDLVLEFEYGLFPPKHSKVIMLRAV